jgi:hypothetical protein
MIATPPMSEFLFISFTFHYLNIKEEEYIKDLISAILTFLPNELPNLRRKYPKLKVDYYPKSLLLLHLSRQRFEVNGTYPCLLFFSTKHRTVFFVVQSSAQLPFLYSMVSLK